MVQDPLTQLGAWLGTQPWWSAVLDGMNSFAHFVNPLLPPGYPPLMATN
ncbi:hypothetical protein [Gordonia sp. MP11Mi]|uniref:Uncharacterized protein n=1 Tax=Gordonia sp. MP11Mi TaxID=3022769 RepID=A0AA97GSM0_9ACTN